MRRAFTRLRWQLTLSHLIAIVVTLVCMITAAVTLVSVGFAWESHQRNEPARDARTVARAVSDLAARGESAELNVVLRLLADGSLRVRARPGSP